MALSTWLDATMKNLADDGVVPYGTLDARWNADRNVSVVTWSDGNRTILLGEAPVQGRKLAIYRVVNDAKVIATIRKAEAKARRDATIGVGEMDDLVAAKRELGIA